jgi:O-acetylserine/cysteine efflux transporter
MRLIHIFLAILTVCIWGFNFVVIKVGLTGIPPIFLVFCRFFLTSLPAIFFVKKPQVPFKMILSYGLVMFALQFSLLFLGMYLGVTPGLAALLLQVQVFFTIFLAVLILKEKLRITQVMGALLSFVGIGCIGFNLGGEMTLTGFLLILGAAASWGPGNIIAKKMGSVNILSLVVWSSLVAWPPLLLVSCLLEGPSTIMASLSNLSWKAGGSVLYITYLSTFLGFALWNTLIHRYTLSMIAPFSLLSPVVGILSSVLVLKEPLQIWKILAGVLIISGLCMNLLGSRSLAIEKAEDN